MRTRGITGKRISSRELSKYRYDPETFEYLSRQNEHQQQLIVTRLQNNMSKHSLPITEKQQRTCDVCNIM